MISVDLFMVYHLYLFLFFSWKTPQSAQSEVWYVVRCTYQSPIPAQSIRIKLARLSRTIVIADSSSLNPKKINWQNKQLLSSSQTNVVLIPYMPWNTWRNSGRIRIYYALIICKVNFIWRFPSWWCIHSRKERANQHLINRYHVYVMLWLPQKRDAV